MASGPGERTMSLPDHEATAPALLRHAVARSGDALLAVRGDQRLTYRELDERSERLAAGLVAHGVGKGSRVALLAPNGPDWIAALFAVTRVGAVATLLNTYQQPRELQWTLAHSDSQHLLLCSEHLGHDYLARLEAVAPELRDAGPQPLFLPTLPSLRAVWVIDGDGRRPWAPGVDELVTDGSAVPTAVLRGLEDAVRPADPMVVVYSSGSTAEPKGAVHSQGGVVRHAHNLWQFRDLQPDDVIYTPMPLFWVGGLSFALMAALHAGAALVFEDRFVPADTLRLMERERVTQVLGWPHMLKALAEDPTYGERRLALKGWGPQGPEADPATRASSLGMTETLGPHTIGDASAALPPGKAGSFGQPVPGVEHRVVDPVSGKDLGSGELGELWVRGYSVMQGLHRHEPGDVFDADGWYRTGDMGYFDDDGHLYFKGRAGEQIKSSGMNVTPREVELVLEELDEVDMALVLGVPHPDRGEDVCAVAVAAPGTAPDPDALRAAVKAELSSYKVPRHVLVLASQAELPWLDSGKVDRRALARRVAELYGSPT